MFIFISMVLLGWTVGFVGAGGAGATIAVLTLLFGIPIHLAVGTSLSAMIFTTATGIFSHFKEGNVQIKIGLVAGVVGAISAFIGSQISVTMKPEILNLCTASMLILSAILVYVRLTFPQLPIFNFAASDVKSLSGVRFWVLAIITGIINGLLSGTFGFGAAQFIQFSLMIFFALPLFQIVGTTMLIIFPIALFGGLGFLISGFLDYILFLQVVSGLMIGAYIGAKFTRLAPRWFLKWMMILMPGVSGVLMVIKNFAPNLFHTFDFQLFFIF